MRTKSPVSFLGGVRTHRFRDAQAKRKRLGKRQGGARFLTMAVPLPNNWHRVPPPILTCDYCSTTL